MKTCLYDTHIKLNAKMVDFAGWQMPIQYVGIIQEHAQVRKHVGMFDVSHMGKILVEGREAENFLSYLSTNKIIGKKELSATYTVFCHENGTAVDDLIIYKIDATHFFLIVNASNREKDLKHLQTYQNLFDVVVKEVVDEGIIALQGPLAKSILNQLIPGVQDLKPMHFNFLNYKNKKIPIAATGYTGEVGVEIYAPNSSIVSLWEELLLMGVIPIGLGARDTLRLEKGYALYGHELSDSIYPIESVSAWTMKNKDFLGEKEQVKGMRKSYGIELIEPGIAREGYLIQKKGIEIGKVTSGTFSPTLNKAIALIMVKGPLEINEEIEVMIRGKCVKARVVPLPFL